MWGNTYFEHRSLYNYTRVPRGLRRSGGKELDKSDAGEEGFMRGQCEEWDEVSQIIMLYYAKSSYREHGLRGERWGMRLGGL